MLEFTWLLLSDNIVELYVDHGFVVDIEIAYHVNKSTKKNDETCDEDDEDE